MTMTTSKTSKLISNSISQHQGYLDVTFQPNKRDSIHRWYPYVEGYSGKFVSRILNELGINRGNVFDPFGGCGTTAVEASLMGIDSLSVDVNPLMCFVAEVKSFFKYSKRSVDYWFQRLMEEMEDFSPDNTPADILNPLFSDKAYFSSRALEEVSFLKWRIAQIKNRPTRMFFLLALASILVKVSNLKRAPDLKYRNDNKILPNPFEEFLKAATWMRMDLDEIPKTALGKATIVCDNIKSPRRLPSRSLPRFDVAITSPPYLNGTNYCRNTKIEQWILDFIREKEDLARLRREIITAGINSAHMGKPLATPFKRVNEIVQKIAITAYDRRIPVMISSYFKDMHKAMTNIHRLLADQCNLIMVIGDSFFGDTYIPTDEILSEIAGGIGFNTLEMRTVRERRSRSGYPLRETILFLKKQG
ncbi:hypothetical protein ES703_01496 [subsurface metagenome]